jgi:hypothetical protein
MRNTFSAVGLVAAAASFPVAAQARPIENIQTPMPPPSPPVVITHDDGFQWADAGVGAAAGFAAALTALGVAAAIRSRRRVVA